MTIDDCFEIGYIVRTVGIKGEVIARLEIEETQLISDNDIIFYQRKGILASLKVNRRTISTKKNKRYVRLKFETLNSIDAVFHMKGCKLFLPLTALPTLDKEDQFYYYQIKGYQIIDKNLGKLGCVEQVYDLGNNDLVMMHYKEKEILIPLNRQIVIDCNHHKKTLNTDLPQGLLDLYLDL